nr:hypothetical protein [Tanacetum cinerariifolium]
MQKVNFDMGKALDVGLVVTESSETKSDKKDTSSRSGNGITYVVDANIKPVYDQVTFAEVNDMAHNYYLEKAKKNKQDKNRNLKPREMPFARTYHTPNACTPKPRSYNQTSRNWPAFKSSEEMLKAVQKEDHSRNSSSFSDSKHFVCSTCQKRVFNANHYACLTKFLKEVNSRIKVQSPKTINSIKPIEKITNVIKPKRWISKGYRFSPNKSFVVHEKSNTPRSCHR